MPTKQKQKKKKKWTKPRHRVVKAIAYALLYGYTRIRYGVTIEKCKDRRQKLVLGNHQTAFDQFIAGMAFSEPLYYITSEDLFSNGFVSKAISYLVAPIPIKKSMTDVRAVMNAMRVAKEGGSICLYPEGNRTYSGKTEYVKPAIAALVKALKLPVYIFLQKGGYGVHPRWSDKTRRGRMSAGVTKIIEYEEYSALSDEELLDLIKQSIMQDDSLMEGTFRSRKTAEYLERVMYVCPDCGLSTFYSKGRRSTCLTCQKSVVYGEDMSIRGEGFEFPFRRLKEWYEYQESFVHALDLSPYLERPMYEDELRLYSVVPATSKTLLAKAAKASLYGDRIVVKGDKEYVLRYRDITAMSVLGRNKLNIYIGDEVFQFKGDKRFNPIKYMHAYYHERNLREGNNGKFLGL
ncbi:MAG: lysophospholipid acyltransferase family protein [Christensenellaceae bacterium]